MKKLNLGSSRWLAAILGVAAASTGWGANAACTSTSAFGTSAPPAAIGTTVGNGGGTINSPTGATLTQGCTAVDDLFSNFSNSASTGSSAYTFTSTPTGGGTDTPGVNPTLNGIYVNAPHDFSGADGTGIEFVTTRTDDTTNNWTMNLTGEAGGGAGGIENGTLTTSFAYSVTGMNGALFTYANLTMTDGAWTVTNGSGGANGASTGAISIEEFVCVGISTFTCATPLSFTVNGASGATIGGSGVTFSATTMLAIEDVITFTGKAGEGMTTQGVSDLSLLNFTDEVGNPEPSTFILFGAGLAGVAAFQLRKRKQKA